ncbi:MAG TPA: GNAT family protein [Thermomicrobiales bacterium]|nr:GNAT family protein [Thermomicrobiales bacterium]
MSTESAARDLPALETARLALRTLRLDDAADLFAYARDPEVARYTSWPAHRTIADAEAFLEWVVPRYGTPAGLTWGIVRRGDDRLIGTIGLGDWQPQHARAELMFALARPHWGRGYMPEAARAVLAFGFTALGLNRIQGMCVVENAASARVMEKVGLRYEGTLREYTYFKGKYDDLKVYAILCADWLAGASAPPTAGIVPPPAS